MLRAAAVAGDALDTVATCFRSKEGVGERVVGDDAPLACATVALNCQAAASRVDEVGVEELLREQLGVFSTLPGDDLNRDAA